MAHVKASGRARQGTPRKGRRLGLKIAGGQAVKTGQIIVRQVGSSFHSGTGTRQGRDFTLYAIREGKVQFRIAHGRKVVEVI
ncbi:MAG: 50S ribosomal protein L27 [Microgenomates group bacterium]